MPEYPPPKRLPRVRAARPVGGQRVVDYAELHCRTNFSFLEGASHADELVLWAAELGYKALAITDRNSVAGVVRAHVAAKQAGLKLLIGAEVTPVDTTPVLLWATDRASYGRLARLLTLGRRAAPKGECRLTFDDVAAHAAGLLAGVLLAPMASGGREPTDSRLGPGSCRSSGGGAHGIRPPLAMDYRAVFGERCYAVAELHRGPADRRLL